MAFVDPDGRFALPLAAFIVFALDVGHRIHNNGQGIPTQNRSVPLSSGFSSAHFPLPGMGGMGPFYDEWIFFPAPPSRTGHDGVPYVGRYFYYEDPSFLDIIFRSRSIYDYMTYLYGLQSKAGWHAMRAYQISTGPNFGLAKNIALFVAHFATLPIGLGGVSAGRTAISAGRTAISNVAYSNRYLGVGSKLFGIGRQGLKKGSLNNSVIRVGWGYLKATHQHVFRLAIGHNPRFYPATKILGKPIHWYSRALFRVPAAF